MATKTILEGSNVADLYKRFEQKGFFMRLDPDIEPTRMRGGTVTKAEMAKIRMVEKVVRKGRIKKLQERKVIFVNGEEMEIEHGTLFIDCSANRYESTKVIANINLVEQH